MIKSKYSNIKFANFILYIIHFSSYEKSITIIIKSNGYIYHLYSNIYNIYII